MADIQSELGIKSKLALPHDLSHVFERLDFLAEGDGISLDSRGDGIKARHIPLILKFMSDKKRLLQGRGAAPTTIVWGYEEPENNLEFRSAIGLADELWRFMSEDVAQIILTSHSPVFYNLTSKNDSQEDYVSCLHVFRSDEERGTQFSGELADLDERIGTTAILAPKLVEIERTLRAQERVRNDAERLAQAGRAKIFVEGTSDQRFVKKLLNEFQPGFIGTEADVETLEAGAGHSYVGDMLNAWYCIQKHREIKPRAVGLLDLDEPGDELRKRWNAIPAQVAICKCYVWPKPAHAISALRANFILPVTLEELYPIDIWIGADESGELEDRSLTSVLPLQVLERIIKRKVDLSDLTGEDFDLYVRRKFTQEGKAGASRRISHWQSDLFREKFAFMRPFVEEVVRYIRGA